MGSDADLRRHGRRERSEEVGEDLLARLTEPNHIVHFCDSAEALCGLVVDYLAAGLAEGDAVIVIATEAHRESFARDLRSRGIEVDRPCASGQLCFLDAREILSRFMVDDMPDWAQFQTVVGGLVRRSRGMNRRARVRAYGEMVDLLWREGNQKAAIRLEEMWDELGQIQSSSLAIAYVVGGFYKERQGEDHPATLRSLSRNRGKAQPRSPEPGTRPANGGAARRADHLGVTARRARRLASEIEHRKGVERALRTSLHELRRAQEALRENQEELRDFVDNAAEGMEWIDRAGTILWANRAQLDLLGYGREEYVGQQVADFRADRETVEDFLERLGRDETLRDYEVRVRCKDGTIKHVLIGANVFRKEGQFVHTRCFTRDITARKRSHDALMRLQAITAGLSEARTQAEVLDAVTRHTIAAVGALGTSVYRLSAEGRSLELARAVGYADRVLDRCTSIPLDSDQPLTDACRRAVPLFLQASEVRERYPQFAEDMADSDSRSMAWLPLMVERRPIGVLGVSHGESGAFGENEQAFLIALTHQCAQALERARLYDAESRARRQAEASQRRSAFLSKASAILSSSLDYGATFANLAHLAVPRIADWCLVELAGEPEATSSELVAADGDPAQVERLREFRRRFPPDPSAEVGVARVIATGKPELHRNISDELLAAFAPDSEYQGFLRQLGFRSAIVVPMTARGRTLGAIVFVSTGLDRRFEPADLEMAEQLGHRAAMAIDNARLYQEARDADRRKDEFLAMLGHELRNPLAPILTGLQLMQLRGIGGERERQIIERQVKYLVRLVDDLLDVSRITRGRVELDKEPVETWSVLTKAIEMASPLFEQRAHLLSVEVPRTGLLVEVDQVRLAQVLANLLTNAAKYTDPHGTVTVSGRREKGEVVISVRDTGIGISPDVLPRIFDMFVQGARALDRSQGGLGIGLTLARSLVAAHGGTITAYSAGRSMGSEFTVRLPAYAGSPLGAREGEPRPAPLRAPRSGKRILLVDDNVDAADVLAEVLRGAGHEVAVAYDAPQALGMARTFEPNAALLDIGLPVLDGYELAERLRELLPGRALRLIAVTGYGQDTDKGKSRAAGFDAHLVKPIDLPSLVALLDEGGASPDERLGGVFATDD